MTNTRITVNLNWACIALSPGFPAFLAATRMYYSTSNVFCKEIYKLRRAPLATPVWKQDWLTYIQQLSQTKT